VTQPAAVVQHLARGKVLRLHHGACGNHLPLKVKVSTSGASCCQWASSS
jgi:hypothetical protein